MGPEIAKEKQRHRAPSKRALQTRARVFDAAEQLFSQKGFDGASMRDIAKLAQVQVGLVHHHGGAKEHLFHQVVARRAEALSALRTQALDHRRNMEDLDIHAVMDCFISPYLDRARHGDPGWQAYAKLLAQVSAEERWRSISEACFDPGAAIFITEIARLYPQASRQRVATSFVFSVAAMLALCTSRWRIAALGDNADKDGAAEQDLITFCCAGLDAMLGA